jgi:hypothetical protein
LARADMMVKMVVPAFGSFDLIGLGYVGIGTELQ